MLTDRSIGREDGLQVADSVREFFDGLGSQFKPDKAAGLSAVYQFDIKDETDQKSFSCQQPRMPYPWHDIVDPLDLASQQGRHQLGDDEPADAKALDKKDKQK